MFKYAVIFVVGFMLSAGVFAVEIEPEPSTNILIVEIQTGSAESAGAEFVELYNPNEEATNITGWLFQYKSATGENWSTKAELEGQIEPRSRYLLATDDYAADEINQEFSSGLAAGAGHIRVAIPAETDDGEETVQDLVGWGENADSAEGDSPAAAPEKGESLKRIVDEDGYFIDTDVNFDDFKISENPSPVTDTTSDTTAEVADEDIFDEDEPVDEGTVEEETTQVLGATDKKIAYDKIWITELFMDPSPPKTDADDEFIELFNPNKHAVQLEGYVIQTGNTYSRSFTIPELKIEPGQYLALYSVDTGLPLSNAGSQARLLDPNGDVIFKTDKYEKAKSDISWVLVNGKWLWSAQVTPAAPNVAVVPASSSTSKSSSSSSSSTGGSSGSSSDDERIIYEEPAQIADTEINKAVLIGVGALAFGYAIFEYRSDISNRFHQFRRHLKSRR